MLEIPELPWPGIEEGVRRLTGGQVKMDLLCEIKEPVIDSFPRRAQISFIELIQNELVKGYQHY